MDKDATAARRRFPTRAPAIGALAARDEGFRDMCSDYATAEAELQKWREAAHGALRDQRLSEYRALADELAKEIEAALDAAAIVPFPRR